MRQFTQEQNLFRDAYRRFLKDEIIPHIAQWREQGIVDRSAFLRAGEQGFLMVWPDEQYGGLGETDFRYEQIIMEEAVRADAREWYATLHSRLVGPYFQRFGNDEQRARFLPKCVSGETILAIAMTEPGAGSDLAGIKSVAEDRGDHFLLNGSKTYISNGINADVIIVAAKLAGAVSRHTLVLLIVERGMEGFERGRNLEKMGLAAQDTAELFFSGVKVPKRNVLGEPGKGFHYLMEGLAEERLIASVFAVAQARRAFDVTRDFVMQRQAFGKPLSEQQNTQFQMAEMDAQIELAEIYVDHCVAEHNVGRLNSNMGAKAKLLTTEIEWKMVDLGVQMHGGAGYMKEYPISDMFTNARIDRIFGGTSEIMRLIIGRDVFSQGYQSRLS